MEMFAIMNYLMKHPMSFTYPNSFLERHNVDSEFCQREVAWQANVKYSAFTNCMQPKTLLSPFQWLCPGNQIASKMIFIQRLKLLCHLWQLRSGFQVSYKDIYPKYYKHWQFILWQLIVDSRKNTSAKLQKFSVFPCWLNLPKNKKVQDSSEFL